jgi:hypothetical protein
MFQIKVAIPSKFRALYYVYTCIIPSCVKYVGISKQIFAVTNIVIEFYVTHFRAYIYILVELTNKCTMFLFHIYFHFFPDMFRHLHAFLKGVHSNYIKVYRALASDS